jgi:hypothetical protein
MNEIVAEIVRKPEEKRSKDEKEILELYFK